MYTALVGAPGQAVVYVFEYNIATGEWDEAQVRTKHALILRTIASTLSTFGSNLVMVPLSHLIRIAGHTRRGGYTRCRTAGSLLG